MGKIRQPAHTNSKRGETMSTLIAITYEDEQTARQAFDALGRLQKQ